MSVRLLKRGLIGFVLGAAVSAAILWRVTTFGGAVNAVWAQLLLSGFYGAACMGGTVLYEIDEWPLMKSTVVHWLIAALLYAPIALILGWTDGLVGLLLTEGILLTAFFLIWLMMYLRCKARVRKLNDMINEGKWKERKDM